MYSRIVRTLTWGRLIDNESEIEIDRRHIGRSGNPSLWKLHAELNTIFRLGLPRLNIIHASSFKENCILAAGRSNSFFFFSLFFQIKVSFVFSLFFFFFFFAFSFLRAIENRVSNRVQRRNSAEVSESQCQQTRGNTDTREQRVGS